ncbi:hypothetical protein ANO11243_002480 [Dothideomycetidae sp. 11243]|nr:hypothetical protein ANO11243_002480 [fungal sp. No.11243]
MWRFIFELSEEDKHRRRSLLDWYGEVAQLSALVPLALLAVYRLVQLLSARGSTAQNVKSVTRSFSWWCGSSLYLWNYPLGTNGEVLGGIVWLAWLLILCANQTGDDYMHLTKRFGIVGASQLPLHYLLAWKSSWSPIARITGRSWEELNRIHQVLGRVITTLFTLHASFYLNFFISAGVLAKRIKDLDVILGLTAITSFTVLGGTALNAVRDKNYRLFFIVHVSVALLVFPVLYFHVSHLRIYILESIAILLVGTLLRRLGRSTVSATVAEVEGADLIEVSVPRSELNKQSWAPGQHVYLSMANTLISTNPFTIASLPAEKKLRLMLRVLRGNTKTIASATKHGSKLQLQIEGPYGHTEHLKTLLRCDRILFVAGGVGATFIAPLHRALMHALSSRTESLIPSKVSLLWTVKTLDETHWALQDMAQPGVAEATKVHLTSSPRKRDAQSIPREGVEMQSLLSDAREQNVPAGVEVRRGRPDLHRVVDEVFAQSATERVAVYVCGPKGMGDRVRDAVGRYVAEGREVIFWNEEFGLS